MSAAPPFRPAGECCVIDHEDDGAIPRRDHAARWFHFGASSAHGPTAAI